MAPSRGPALAAAMWMIDRVHGDTAHAGAFAQPAFATRLGQFDVLLVGVGYRANGGHAITLYVAHLARTQAEQRIPGFAADQLRVGPPGAGHLANLETPASCNTA